MSKKGGFGKFLAGAAIGAGIALLFAPQEGSKTRKQLKAKFDELLEKVKNIDVAEVKADIERKISEIKADLADLDGEKVLAMAKEKGKAIVKKCDDLVKLAVAKGTPVVKKLVNDVRLKTIDVLEETITKLEGADKTPATNTGATMPKITTTPASNNNANKNTPKKKNYNQTKKN